jgi:putative MFS transporter
MAVGSLIAGVLGDRIGRKITYMYNLALYTLGALIGAFAPNIDVLYLGRLIVGIGLGGELNAGLTIVSEFVATKYRGSSVAVVNIAAGGLGIFLSAALSFLILGPLSAPLGGENVAWRWVLGILALPALLLWVYRLYIPESPRYLLSRGRVGELNTVLSLLERRTLRESKMPEVEQYFSHQGESELEEKTRLREIFEGYLAKRTFGLWTISWMTFGAQVAITVFFPTVLVSQGYDIAESLFFTMIINVGGLIGAILSSYFAAKLPRRWVLGFGALVAVGVAVLYAMVKSTELIILVGALMQLMFIFLNTTTWLYAPELYPTRVRAFGTGASVVVALISASVMPYVAGLIFDVADVIGLFGMVAVMYFIMSATVFFMNVETKDKSLEEASEA